MKTLTIALLFRLPAPKKSTSWLTVPSTALTPKENASWPRSQKVFLGTLFHLHLYLWWWLKVWFSILLTVLQFYLLRCQQRTILTLLQILSANHCTQLCASCWKYQQYGWSLSLITSKDSPTRHLMCGVCMFLCIHIGVYVEAGTTTEVFLYCCLSNHAYFLPDSLYENWDPCVWTTITLQPDPSPLLLTWILAIINNIYVLKIIFLHRSN